MKKLVILLMLTSQVAFVNGQIKKQNVKSKINEITVFYTSAEIEREAKINLKKGMNKLIYSNITPKIKKESIYAIIDKDIKVVSVNTHKKVIYPDKKRILALQDTIELLDEKIENISVDIVILHKSMNVLDANSTNAKADVNQVIELNEYYNKRIKEIYLSINKKTNKLNNLEKIKEKTELKLKQLKSTSVNYDGMEIELVLMAKKDLTASNIKIKYIVGGTGWTPVYKINVNKLEENINVGFQAKVINQTGINWDNIKLSFSTSSPDKTQDTPKLETWNLNFANKNINEGRLDKFKVRDLTANEAKDKNKGIDIMDGVKYVETSDIGINNIYRTSNKYYIPSDYKSYFIDLKDYKLPVTYRYYSVPKVDADAFLVAQITDWEKYNLIEGQTKVWYNGSYIGESYIRPQLASDTLDISLGRDSKIFVNRVKLKDKDSEKLVGTNKKQTYKYKLTVKNTNSTDVKFTLKDQIPISQDDDIKIEQVELSNAELDEDLGSLKWKFDLKPGESREFIVAFSVKFPKNRNLKIRSGRSIASNASVRFL